VLLAGGSDFTLIGRPIISPELVSVHATVIEKALSHIKTVFKKKPRKQYQRINCKQSTGTEAKRVLLLTGTAAIYPLAATYRPYSKTSYSQNVSFLVIYIGYVVKVNQSH